MRSSPARARLRICNSPAPFTSRSPPSLSPRQEHGRDNVKINQVGFLFHLAARTPSERQNLTLIEHDSSPSSSISHAPPRLRASFSIRRASLARLANEHYRQSPRYNGSFINRQRRSGQITASTHPSLTVSLFLSG